MSWRRLDIVSLNITKWVADLFGGQIGIYFLLFPLVNKQCQPVFRLFQVHIQRPFVREWLLYQKASR